MTFTPQSITLLTGATLPDGSVVDVTIEGDTVVSVTPAASLSAGAGAEAGADAAAKVAAETPGSASSSPTADAALDSGHIDLRGHILLTAPAEPHAHLDKALSWEAIRPPMGDLVSAITSWREYARTMTVDDIAGRAREQLLRMLSNGTTSVRTHVDILLGDEPLRGAEALVRVREELRGLVDLELVALAGPDVPDSSIEAALDLGVDLVGGSSHLAADPSGDLQRLLAIAARRGVGVDLHTDESLAGAVTLGEFAETVVDWTVPVSAGHCVRLGTVDAEARDLMIAAVKKADIGVIANPITNLYLQGWEHPVSMPRGLTPARQLLDAGVRLAAGADNVRDPFNPLGRSDALETTMLMVTAGHLTIDEAYTAVSDGARSVMALPEAGVRVGAKAELLAVKGSSLADVTANAPADRYVIHAGRLVARSRSTVEVAGPAVLTPTMEAR